MTAPERPGPERPGPDYPPEWDNEPSEVTHETWDEWQPEHDEWHPQYIDGCDACADRARLPGQPLPDLHVVLELTVPEPNDGPGPDGHHVITGECFACMVGVATGPESHGDRCPHSRVTIESASDMTQSESRQEDPRGSQVVDDLFDVNVQVRGPSDL